MEPLASVWALIGLVVSFLGIVWYLSKALPVQIKEGETYEHSHFKVVAGVAALYMLLFIPTIMVGPQCSTEIVSQAGNGCELVLTNTTEFHEHLTPSPNDELNTTTDIVYIYQWHCSTGPPSQNLTNLTYSYEEVCVETADDTGGQVLKVYTRILWLFGVYGFAVLILWAIWKFRIKLRR